MVSAGQCLNPSNGESTVFIQFTEWEGSRSVAGEGSRWVCVFFPLILYNNLLWSVKNMLFLFPGERYFSESRQVVLTGQHLF